MDFDRSNAEIGRKMANCWLLFLALCVLCVCMRVGACVYMCVCMRVGACVYMCVCAYVCMSVCVC